jgi:hypothetical protein
VDDFSAAPLQGKIALATLAAALAISVVTDLRRRLILNIVTYPALIVVASCFLWLGGLPLLLEAGLGALVCAGPFALMMLRGWMGAGDVKLMAVAGAVSGAAAGWPSGCWPQRRADRSARSTSPTASPSPPARPSRSFGVVLCSRLDAGCWMLDAGCRMLKPEA